MEQNLNEPLSVEALADRVGISTRHLERVFSRDLECSPHAFYLRLRLRYALWMLRHTARTVTDIALESGFADSGHFSRCFRAEFGMAPRQFRALADADEVADGRIDEAPRIVTASPVTALASRH